MDSENLQEWEPGEGLEVHGALNQTTKEPQKNLEEKTQRFSSVFLLNLGQSVTYDQRFVWDAKCEWESIPTATLGSNGWMFLCCSSITTLQWKRCGVTSKALLMPFCLQISDDGNHWWLSLGSEPRRPITDEAGGTMELLRFLILTLPYPTSPELQMSTERPQASQLHHH